MEASLDNQQENSLGSMDAAHHLHGASNPNAEPMIVAKGQGIRVVGEDGNSYIEGLAGLWCAALGFDEPRLVEAATRQMQELPFYHSFLGRSPIPTTQLAGRLAAVTPEAINKFFFACSGSEAVDSAIKMIWYYNNALGRPEKKKIISRQNAYHGVTVAAASLTRLKMNQDGFDLPLDRFLQVECPHFYRFGLDGETEEEFSARLAANLEQTILDEGPDTIAAFFAEPVQGAGGIIVPPKGYFDLIQPILKKYNILFVVDEVICGFGRTGQMFGSDTYGLKPDLMTMAKGLSAAYQPISAVGLTQELYDGIAGLASDKGAFGHGFTYGGHPVAAAVALETLNIFADRNVVGHVQHVSVGFQNRLAALQDHPLVGEARGVGLLGALELVADKAGKTPFDPALAVGQRVFEETKKNGLLFRPFGDQLLFAPPLIVTDEDVNEIFDILTDALDSVSKTL